MSDSSSTGWSFWSVGRSIAVVKVRDNYLDESLEDLAYDLEIPLPDLFQACAVQK